MSDRYPGLRILGTDSATTLVSSPWTMEKPAMIASDSEIREALKSTRKIAEYVTDGSYDRRLAVLQGELVLRARIDAGVVLPDTERPYQNTWHKDERKWTPSKAVYAVRLVSDGQGNRRHDLGYGSISNPLFSPAQAIRFAEYFRARGWVVEPVAVPCLFSEYADHIPLEKA